MTKHKSHARPAMTAIAAVLAFSSTPLFAQDAAAPMDAPSPVSISPTPTPTPDAVPAIVAAPTAPATIATPDPVLTTTTADEASPVRVVAKSKPAAKVAKTPIAKSITPVAVAKTSSVATVLSEKPVALAPPASVGSSAPVLATATSPAAPVEAQTPAPVPKTDPINDTLPYAAGAGAALLALAGAGIALRRRRHDEEADEMLTAVDTFDAVEATPIAAVEPAVIVAEPKAYLPVIDQGNDSPRVAAAHAGPSEDNPSLSLKKRIKRAHALDQMEQNGHSVPAPAGSSAPVAKASVSTWATPARGLMFGQTSTTPAFSH